MKVRKLLIVASLLGGAIAIAAQGDGAPGGMMGGHHMPGMGGHMQGMMGGQGMADMMRHMQNADANQDGMLSRAEFLAAHSAMYDAMPKNQQGLVDMKNMSMSMSACPMMSGQMPAQQAR